MRILKKEKEITRCGDCDNCIGTYDKDKERDYLFCKQTGYEITDLLKIHEKCPLQKK